MTTIRSASALLIFSALTFVVFSLSFDAIVLGGPRIFASVLTPTAAKQCERLKIGMSRANALDEIDGYFPAPAEVARGNTITFSGRGGSCVVEFDPSTQSVKASYVERDPDKQQWDLGEPDRYRQQ